MTLSEEHATAVPASRTATWAVVERLGGTDGWGRWTPLWRARAFADGLVGGAGAGRGRPGGPAYVVGEVVDWWRVVSVEPGERVRLRAEMRMPGTAYLEIRLAGPDDGPTSIRMRTEFEPVGVAGRAYWFGQLPMHRLVFGDLLRDLARRSAGPR